MPSIIYASRVESGRVGSGRLNLNRFKAGSRPTSHIFFLSHNFRMNRQNDHKVDELYKVYLDPSSHLFLDSNTQRIYEQANRDATLAPTTHAEIYRYQRSLEDISRARQRRNIGQKQRHLSQRKWITWAPKCVLLGRTKPK